MPQYARPDSEVSNTGWTAQGGPANTWECVDEVSPSDTDYIRCSGSTYVIVFNLSNVTDPASSSGHVVRIRARATGSGGAEKWTVQLRQGATTLICTPVNAATMARSWTTITYNLTTAEADLITDYTDLRLRIATTAIGASEIEDVSWAEFEVPSVGHAPLVADYGAYTQAGQGAGILAARLISAGQGSYTLSGQDAQLRHGYSMQAEAGAFTLSGQDAGLKASRKITADFGAYIQNGQAASLRANRKIVCGEGAYLASGQDAALLAGRKLNAGYGIYTLDGQPADLNYTGLTGYTLTAEYGAYLLSGKDAGLTAARKLGAGYGVYALTGQDAGLVYAGIGNYTLIAEYGSYVLSGQAATLGHSAMPGEVKGFVAIPPPLGNMFG